MVKHLAGATPVYTTTAPLMDADYSGLVYKLFRRGNEDIIALWSNAEAASQHVLNLAPGVTRFKQVTLPALRYTCSGNIPSGETSSQTDEPSSPCAPAGWSCPVGTADVAVRWEQQ